MKQKNSAVFCLFMLGALILSSCEREDDTILKVSATSCAFNAAGGEKTVLVASDKSSWNFKVPDGSWFTASKSDGLIEIRVPANTLDTIRSGKVTVWAGNATVDIDVWQESASNYTPGLRIFPSDESYKVHYGKGSLVFSVLTDGDWEASADGAWITVETDKEKGLATVLWERNEQNLPNGAELTISCGEESKTMSITQYTKEQDPYFSLIGKWDLYCSKWLLLDDGSAPEGGSYAYMYLDENVPYESYVLRELFFDTLETVLLFDEENDRLMWPLYVYSCYESETRRFYYAQVTINVTDDGEKLDYNLNPVDGYVSENRTRIDFHGEEGLGIGVLGLNKSTGATLYFSDLYYANADDYYFKFSEEQQPVAGRPLRVVDPVVYGGTADTLSAFTKESIQD